MRPTGKLHLGHSVGALNNWIELQKEHACIFGIVDWHALMGEYEYSKEISKNKLVMTENNFEFIFYLIKNNSEINNYIQIFHLLNPSQ